MTEGLWDWQDEDVRRLRREQKDELAQCWDQFELDGAELKASAELAREMNEPVWEMFYLHWYVQQGLFRENHHLQQLQPAVQRLAELAEMQRCGSCPQRFCARESVANFQLAADPPGFAPDVLEMSRAMAEQVPSDLECSGCFDLLEAGALMEMKRLDDALVVLDRIDTDPVDDNLPLLLELYRAAIAHERSQLDTMDVHLRAARTMLDSGAEPNPDNLWFLLEMEIHRALADDDLERAEALLHESRPTPPPLSSEAVRIALALAKANARWEQWSESHSHAERALAAARTRGMVRYAAEAALWAAEACREEGDSEGQTRYSTELMLLLPQLGSRDLDERAHGLAAD